MPKHEIVVPDDHLPAWLYLHEQNQPAYIRPHWHTSVEISYTLSGSSINNFFIAGQSYKTRPGQILVINSADLHSIRAIHDSKQDPRALTIIFPIESSSAIDLTSRPISSLLTQWTWRKGEAPGLPGLAGKIDSNCRPLLYQGSPA